jgi:DNA mismatch repair protein MutL
MPTIQQLSPSMINKIAAGEVIERPASVVKELLENAVDSGARRIDVTVEQGGGALIRVADDGSGIAADELTLAVASHATSKIRDADDLFCVQTMGFRGEALASIAEVSQLRIRSRTKAADAGYELEVTGGTYSEVVPCGCPVGTSVEVRNLFCNTPVRRKFMRTTQTEMAHASEAFTRIALANANIHMTLRHGERTLFDLPPAENWRDRIVAFFGSEIGENLIWVESNAEPQGDESGAGGTTRLSGYVANPQISRSNTRMQYLFLNGRFIRDRSLQHALGEAYRGLLMVGRMPIAFIRLELPPGSIDVNVHPTKLEVRFQDGGKIYSHLLATLRGRFLTSDLTAKVSADPVKGTGQPVAMAASDIQQHRERVSNWAQGRGAQGEGDTATLTTAPVSHQEDLPFGSPRDRTAAGSREFVPFPGAPPAEFRTHGLGAQDSPSEQAREPRSQELGVGSGALGLLDPSVAETSGDRAGSSSSADSTTRPIGLQLHDRYLVTESELGMVVIDQHALHERILYEQIRTKALSGTLERQQLLVPEPVSLTAAESAAVLEAREMLAQLGLEIEPFGGDTVLVSTYPAMLAKIAPEKILRHAVDLLLSGGKSPDRRDLLDELLHMMSCKAAVKAGDPLAFEEVQELLEQRQYYQDSHHCPHGRPTALLFSCDELDRRFKRI